MFFRNATMFHVPKGFIRSLPDLNNALSEQALRPCGPLEFATRGFVSPFGDGYAAMACAVGAAHLLTSATNQKILPPAAIAMAVKERIKKTNPDSTAPIGNKTRKRIKAEVIDELLPRALVKQTSVDAYLDGALDLIVVDTGSRKAAEAVLTGLRNTLGSFPTVPLVPVDPPSLLMTSWLSGATPLPDGLELGDECELRDPAEGATARCGRQALEAREVLEHLKSGKRVRKLGLIFNGHVSFVLRDDLTLSKIAFLDGALEGLDSDSSDGVESEIAARFALMSGELAALFNDLFEWFGVEGPAEEA